MRNAAWFFTLAAVLALAAPHPASAQQPPLPGGPGGSPPSSLADAVRRILDLTPPEREAFLASKRPEYREFLQAKFAEYDALAPAERESRLRTAQLRYYLSPLLKLTPSNRPPLLVRIPAEDRPLVEERLAVWDALPVSERERFLAYESALRATAETNTLALLPTNVAGRERDQLERQMQALASLPPQDQVAMRAQFDAFFGLASNKVARAATQLTESERIALLRIAQLPKEQRDRMLAGFEKFSRLSAEERTEFLKAAYRWQAMTDAQRQAWREAVRRLPAQMPLPDVFRGPPSPPGFRAGQTRPAGAGQLAATNSLAR